MKRVDHPAKYSDIMIPIFADILKDCENILDPMAGTCKISKIKDFGFSGNIYANELEIEWVDTWEYKDNLSGVTIGDASNLIYENNFFDGICTSPTYGNRMADHHIAKDNSRRMTYTHRLGRQLTEGNTGKMQWGNKYKQTHTKIYRELFRCLKHNGILVLNISNHIRKGKEQFVSEWTKDVLIDIGFLFQDDIHIKTNRMGFGSNKNLRVEYEHIYIFKK